MGNLPKAHTCFNRLDLPRYPTYNHLKEAMDYIAKNEIRGFGIEEWKIAIHLIVKNLIFNERNMTIYKCKVSL